MSWNKIESFANARRRKRAGCGFLAQRDVEQLLENTLSEDRRSRFEAHRQGCAACLQLDASMRMFLDILTVGPHPIEANQFASTENALKRELRQAFRSALGDGQEGLVLPWSREISTDELRHIAAAGPDSPPADPSPEDSSDPETP